MERLIALIIGYICGLFQTSFIIGKIYKKDIRDYGSGNAGTTNALRVLGKKAAALTLLGDCVKTILAISIVRMLFENTCMDILPLLSIYAALGTILGHNFPFYMKFRGGKGFAASVGFAIAFDWKMFVLGLIVFVIVIIITKYVSLGSMLVYVLALCYIIIMGQKGSYGISGKHLTELYLVMLFMTALAIFQHRKNIVRLLSGTENKLFSKKSEAKKD